MPTIVAECVRLVRDRIGPVAAFKDAVVVDRLPKTRSGKILRGVMGQIADGKDWKMPATIDDPAILGEIGDTPRRRQAIRAADFAIRRRTLRETLRNLETRGLLLAFRESNTLACMIASWNQLGIVVARDNAGLSKC